MRARLSIIEVAIMQFVQEKEAEGFSPEEIDQLYALELPLMFGYRVDAGRLRASMTLRLSSALADSAPRLATAAPCPREAFRH